MIRISFVAVLLSILTGCNLFSFVDAPSGDIQILSAARACFDRGDYDCASRYYSQLSSAYSDQAISEGVFSSLSQNFANVGTFLNAFISGAASGGKIVTSLANGLIPHAGETLRLAYFHAYQRYASIVNPQIRGLIRFETSLLLVAELLAENSVASGRVKTSDLVSNPAGCLAAADIAAAGVSAACEKPATSLLIAGANISSLTSAQDSDLSGTPSLFMINAALAEVQAGLSELGVTGGAGSSSSSFATAVLAGGTFITFPNSNSPGYRWILITSDIGGS